MKAKITPLKPFLMMFYGYPGCGKSFFAGQFSKEFQNTIYLPSYKIKSDIADLSAGNIQLAEKIFDYICESYLKNGLSVITDVPVIKRTDRKKLAHMALLNKTSPLLVWMQIDPDTAFLRTKLREKNKHSESAARYTKQAFEEITNTMQNPQNEDFFVISGKHTYKSQRSQVMNKMSSLKIISREQASKDVAKPGLVNLIPPSLSGRSGVGRNISIR